MKVQIFNWAGDAEARRLLGLLGYEHSHFYDVEGTIGLFLLVQNLHALGLNVMIPRPYDDGTQLVAVDYNSMFRQR